MFLNKFQFYCVGQWPTWFFFFENLVWLDNLCLIRSVIIVRTFCSLLLFSTKNRIRERESEMRDKEGNDDCSKSQGNLLYRPNFVHEILQWHEYDVYMSQSDIFFLFRCCMRNIQLTLHIHCTHKPSEKRPIHPYNFECVWIDINWRISHVNIVKQSQMLRATFVLNMYFMMFA